MMAPQVLQEGASPMLYISFMRLAAWGESKTPRSSTLGRASPMAGRPVRAARSGAIPCCGARRSFNCSAEDPWVEVGSYAGGLGMMVLSGALTVPVTGTASASASVGAAEAFALRDLRLKRESW